MFYKENRHVFIYSIWSLYGGLFLYTLYILCVSHVEQFNQNVNIQLLFPFHTGCGLRPKKQTLCLCLFQCVANSKRLPAATVAVVKDNPEMTDWVHSMHRTAPFYISNNNYTKIAVDRVQAVDKHMYNILLLATGKLFPTDLSMYCLSSLLKQ